ncbi:hypothetical protein NMY22_g345 [Coprinellus aureogranulatus]|nr:hypothetical protein NMY22_g345 [Coprinellus aureogranulatus]
MDQTIHLLQDGLLQGSRFKWDPRSLPGHNLPHISKQTAIGIVVAISGNVLISFALNLQKLVHKRTQQRRDATNEAVKHGSTNNDDALPEDPNEEDVQDDRELDSSSSTTVAAALVETQPLIEHPSISIQDYGATAASPSGEAPSLPSVTARAVQSRTLLSRLIPFKLKSRHGPDGHKTTLPIDIVTEEAAMHGLSHHNKKSRPAEDCAVEQTEGDYLKSKTWWLGFLLMNIGELGNFISYAFAPASVVAPLGTFALIANCFFAPLMLREKFRRRDLVGVCIAIIGAVTVVLASNASDTRLDADSLLHAILQIPFLVFSIVYIVGVVVLAGLSESSLGRRFVVIDVGLCALFGGFTVLSTKAISTLLTIHWLEMFTKWITYPLLLVLVSTGVGQIRYLNRALMRFDSKTVIPIQFVFFTLSAIIGSAILYGDFKKAQFQQIVMFLYGCAATFAGVFVIAWAPSPSMQGEIEPEDEEHPVPVPGSTEQARLGPATIGRRSRATLVLPSGVSNVRETHSMRRKHSAVSMGLSPAQHLLLVHTPPVSPDGALAARGADGLGDTDTEFGSPESYRRRRTMSCLLSMTAALLHCSLCIFGQLAAILLVSFVFHGVRRLVLHPLSNFPGPKLAAFTSLYKIYYEIVREGKWLHHVDELHRVYGDVVRVGPNELHFTDPKVYNKIFSVGVQFTKDPAFYTCFGVDMSTFGLMDPDRARRSRELMSVYFNRRAILELEGVIQAKVDKLVALLASNRTPSDMFYAFRCATMDIIITHCFGPSSAGCLDVPGFRAAVLSDIQLGIPLLWIAKAFPWMLPIIAFLPRCMTGRLAMQFDAFVRVQDYVLEKVQAIKRPSSDTRNAADTNVVQDLLIRYPTSENMRLFHEGLSLIQAGSDPVATACLVGFVQILGNPSLHARLKRELRDAFPDPCLTPSWADFERVTYLTAVIKESLRMSHGFVSSVPRVVGPCGAELGGHCVPPNTVVSMSAVSVHNNPALFPEPHQFRPERWLESKDLGQHLVAFSKGPRMCLGVNMAWAELYCLFGTMFRKLEMALVDTSPQDYADFLDYFIPVHTGRHLQIQATLSDLK